jgi:hypothetical protein
MDVSREVGARAQNSHARCRDWIRASEIRAVLEGADDAPPAPRGLGSCEEPTRTQGRRRESPRQDDGLPIRQLDGMGNAAPAPRSTRRSGPSPRPARPKCPCPSTATPTRTVPPSAEGRRTRRSSMPGCGGPVDMNSEDVVVFSLATFQPPPGAGPAVGMKLGGAAKGAVDEYGECPGTSRGEVNAVVREPVGMPVAVAVPVGHGERRPLRRLGLDVRV